MEPIDLAIEYFDRMQEASDKAKLSEIAQEIRSRTDELPGYIGWLRDAWSSVNWCLSLPEVPIEKMLNKRGLMALKKGTLCG